MATEMDQNSDFVPNPDSQSSNPMDWPWRKRAEHVPKVAGRLKADENDHFADLILLTFAQDPKWEVRRAVAENLLGLPEESLVHLLGKLLKDPNQDVRSSAVRVQRELEKLRAWSSDPDNGSVDIETLYTQMAHKFGLAAAKRAREIAGQQMTMLVGPVVHDIRNQIQNIISAAKDIASAQDKDSVNIDPKAESGKIMNAAQRTLRMVNALLDYSKPMQLNISEENLADLLNRCVASIQSRTSKKGATIGFFIDVDPKHAIWVDRDQAERLMTNLINNAAQSFSHPKCEQDAPEVRITADFNASKGNVMVHIADNGHGMREEDLKEVNKLLPIKSNKPDGAGFGLASAGQIAFAHRGSIHLDSNHGKGTVATVILPNNHQE